VPWPELKHIAFKEVVFPRGDQSLVSVLRERAGVGFALESVTLRNCWVWAEVEMLRGIVGRVDWDGLQVMADEESDDQEDEQDQSEDDEQNSGQDDSEDDEQTSGQDNSEDEDQTSNQDSGDDD